MQCLFTGGAFLVGMGPWQCEIGQSGANSTPITWPQVRDSANKGYLPLTLWAEKPTCLFAFAGAFAFASTLGWLLYGIP